MRRTKIASRELSSGAVVASSRQTVRDFGFPFRVAGGLLHDKPFCAGVDPDAQHFWPQAFSASLAMDSGCDAGALAWRAANNDICSPAGEGTHVTVDGNAWEVMGEQPLAYWVDLDELHDIKTASGSKADGVPADVAKKVDDIHSVRVG
jgi:hypothetical protein